MNSNFTDILVCPKSESTAPTAGVLVKITRLKSSLLYQNVKIKSAGGNGERSYDHLSQLSLGIEPESDSRGFHHSVV